MRKHLVSKTFFKFCALSIILLLNTFVGSFGRLSTAKTFAEEKEKVEIKVFWSYGCTHCSREREFLEKLAIKDNNIVITEYEVSRDMENLLLLRDYGEKFSTDISGVPFTVIGEIDYLSGFRSDETTGLAIVNKVRKILGELPLTTLDWDKIGKTGGQEEIDQYPENTVEEIPEVTQNQKDNEWLDETSSENAVDIVTPLKIKDQDNEIEGGAPFSLGRIDLLVFKNVDLEKMSLPLLTVVLALADGLNPCAMWVLLFLISLLIKVESPKRRWLIGSIFILASGIVYFLFLTAWLKFFLFIGFIQWTRYLIGTVALGAAHIYIKEFIQNPTGCKVIGGNENRKKVFSKLREYALKDNILVAAMGMIVLAFGVNLVEFFCSAGLPATYSNILAMSNLNSGAHYAYMMLYIVVFMIDDFIIFAIAMVTLRAVGVESKYVRWAHLLGGLIMLLIGLSLFLKPELLMFG